MLKIHYGKLESDNYIFNPDAFFNNTYEDEWIMDELSKQMIKDIDGSEVIGPRVIDSPFLGSIPTERLSGGVKTLILMNNDQEHVFNASACGDNCAKWILEISGRLAREIMNFIGVVTGLLQSLWEVKGGLRLKISDKAGFMSFLVYNVI